jgi:hypothetical protein
VGFPAVSSGRGMRGIGISSLMLGGPIGVGFPAVSFGRGMAGAANPAAATAGPGAP